MCLVLLLIIFIPEGFMIKKCFITLFQPLSITHYFNHISTLKVGHVPAGM